MAATVIAGLSADSDRAAWWPTGSFPAFRPRLGDHCPVTGVPLEDSPGSGGRGCGDAAGGPGPVDSGQPGGRGLLP